MDTHRKSPKRTRPELSREDGVPTLFELAKQIADVDTDFFQLFLRRCAHIQCDKDTEDIVVDFVGLAGDYYKTITVPSSSPDAICNMKDDDRIKMEAVLHNFRLKLAKIEK
jgi:hypothetical protein